MSKSLSEGDLLKRLTEPKSCSKKGETLLHFERRDLFSSEPFAPAAALLCFASCCSKLVFLTPAHMRVRASSPSFQISPFIHLTPRNLNALSLLAHKFFDRMQICIQCTIVSARGMKNVKGYVSRAANLFIFKVHNNS